MTTETFSHYRFADVLEASVPNERVAAIVTVVAFLLLLPASTVLMAVLTA